MLFVWAFWFADSRAQGQTEALPVAELYRASLHTFAVVRSGVAVDDPITGVHHPASHTQDAVLAGGGRRNLSGGWYNAADYGKWTMMAAISVSYMLDLYRLQQRTVQLPVQPDPALLKEAQWGLAWLLEMQDPDGGVRYKVDGVTQASLAAAWGKPPELDPNVRIAAQASTGSTADFAAVLYEAARVFAARDPKQSDRFRTAADRAWTWVGEHPAVLAHDPFYADHDPGGEMLWAAAEHALSYRKFTSTFAQKIDIRHQAEVSWRDPSLLGLYDLASSHLAPSDVRATATRVVLESAGSLANVSAAHPFRVVLGDRDYSWGSAERVLHNAALLLMADSLQPSFQFRQAAYDQLAWMLGNNAAQHSFVTAFGTNPVQHPWHWIYRDYGIVLPGWTVLGPNSYPDGVDPALRALQERGTPPALCYVDLCSSEGSWASNEGEITEEAALVFVTGVLRSSPQGAKVNGGPSHSTTRQPSGSR